MRVFLSWSGARSKAMAEALRDWLPMVIQAVECWMSPDMEKGRRWDAEIAKQLEESHVGIFCLTPEERTGQWLVFEAGAISKRLDESRVCTVLLDLKPTDVDGPLASFQHTTLQSDDVFKLVATVNRALATANEKPVAEMVLRRGFDAHWPGLDTAMREIPKFSTALARPARPDRALLEEILEVVRAFKSMPESETYQRPVMEAIAPNARKRLLVSVAGGTQPLMAAGDIAVFIRSDLLPKLNRLSCTSPGEYLTSGDVEDGGYTLTIASQPRDPVYEARVVIARGQVAKHKVKTNLQGLTVTFSFV